MKLSIGGSCMKRLIIMFNMITFICGAVLLGVGIWVASDPWIKDYLSEIVKPGDKSTLLTAATVVVLVGGGIMFVVGFFGCYGARKENSCVLATFAVMLGIVLLLEIVATILAIAFKTEIEDGLKNEMLEEVKAISLASSGTLSLTAQAWHAMQVNLKCCGAENWTDYSNFGATQIPQTCCVLTNQDPMKPQPRSSADCYEEAKLTVATNITELHYQGCHQALISWLKEIGGILTGVSLVIEFLQIVSIIFAVKICREILKKKNSATS